MPPDPGIAWRCRGREWANDGVKAAVARRCRAGPSQGPAPRPPGEDTRGRGEDDRERLQLPECPAVAGAPRAVTRLAEAGRKWVPRAERPAGPGSGCPYPGGGAACGAGRGGGGDKMAADLEAEVQAIDKSLLECSAEEIAVVRPRARGGRARSGRGGEGAWRP